MGGWGRRREQTGQRSGRGEEKRVRLFGGVRGARCGISTGLSVAKEQSDDASGWHPAASSLPVISGEWHPVACNLVASNHQNIKGELEVGSARPG